MNVKEDGLGRLHDIAVFNRAKVAIVQFEPMDDEIEFRLRVPRIKVLWDVLALECYLGLLGERHRWLEDFLFGINSIRGARNFHE